MIGLIQNMTANQIELIYGESVDDRNARKGVGWLPTTGKARLFVANECTMTATVIFDERDYKVASGAGADSFSTGLTCDLEPWAIRCRNKSAGPKGPNRKAHDRCG